MDLLVDNLVAAGACLLGAGFVSSVETALWGVPAARVRAAVERGEPGAGQLEFWVRSPGLILTALNLLRLVLVVTATVAGWLAVQAVALDLGSVLAIVAIGIAALVVSHLVPRALAKRFAFTWAVYTMWFVRLVTALTLPLAWPLSRVAGRIGRLAGEDSGTGAYWTPSELERVGSEARADALGQQQEDLILSIIEFADTIVSEIMVPRTGMVAIAIDSPPDAVSEAVHAAGHSRIPVYEETVDNVLGVLHVKDLVRAEDRSEPSDVRSLLRSTFYVPEVMKISELLREFQRRKTHMAIVVDEYGGTSGLVTLEDIIEEIVGEIEDEHDTEKSQFRVLADNRILADGRVNVWDLEEPLGVEFPKEGDYETLAGFLMLRSGYLLEPGAKLVWGELQFTVKEADQRRIRTVEIERIGPERVRRGGVS